jgi:23S rRNA pseudoU1915 N3-methylase RlmH
MYTILCISDSDKHFATAIQEYKKRMPKKLDIIDIKPVKNGLRSQIIHAETEKIIQKLAKGGK